MSTQINIDIFDTKGLKETLQWLYDNIDKEANEILNEIIESGQKYAKKQYSRGVKDDNLSDKIVLKTDSTNNSKSLIASGTGIIYREFGTGDEGALNPHEAKSKFDLDDYNSGGTITDISDIHDEKILQVLADNGVTSGKFWYYPKNSTNKGHKVEQMTLEQKQSRARYLINHSGEVNITQGVSAGQEMWNTRNYLLEKAIPKIIKKRGKMINDKFNKSIKR